LRSTLERTPWDKNSPTYDEDGPKVTSLDPKVQAASFWIRYCGEELYNDSLKGGDMIMEYARNGTNFGIIKGWSKERWSFWKRRFLEISEMEELLPETRYVAKESAERMDAIEKEKNVQ
jgi:hypothetical protein